MDDKSVNVTLGKYEDPLKGSAYIFGYILRSYATLGVTNQEVMLLIHLISFKYGEFGVARPSLTTISKFMGLDIRSVRRLVKSLRDKEMLVVSEVSGRPNVYNFESFAGKCMEIYHLSTLDKNVRGQAGTPDKNVIPPRTKMSYEYKEDNINIISLSGDQKILDAYWSTFVATWQKSPHPLSAKDNDAIKLFLTACKKTDPIKIISYAESYVQNYLDASKAGLNPTYIFGAVKFLDRALYNEKLPVYIKPSAQQKSWGNNKPTESRPTMPKAKEIFAETDALRDKDEKLTNMQNEKLDKICPDWRKEYENIKSKKLGGMNAALYRMGLIAEHAI